MLTMALLVGVVPIRSCGCRPVYHPCDRRSAADPGQSDHHYYCTL